VGKRGALIFSHHLPLWCVCRLGCGGGCGGYFVRCFFGVREDTVGSIRYLVCVDGYAPLGTEREMEDESREPLMGDVIVQFFFLFFLFCGGCVCWGCEGRKKVKHKHIHMAWWWVFLEWRRRITRCTCMPRRARSLMSSL
jgi:hypothetical protein